VTGITGAEVVATGGNFTCVLLPTGHVECLGSDQYGSLGNGTSTEDGLDTPVEVEGITEATR
jgi:alpha-tubulin suppressor-like RCC1 family protein